MDTKYRIVAFYGRSGAGKDSYSNIFLDSNHKDFNKIIRCTTRPQRENEKDGNEYNFISTQEMLNRIMSGEVFEASAFGPQNWVYGTSFSSLDIDKINVGTYDIESVLTMAGDPDLDILPVYLKVSPKEAIIRALKREENPDIYEVMRRFKEDDLVFFDLGEDKIESLAEIIIDTEKNHYSSGNWLAQISEIMKEKWKE